MKNEHSPKRYADGAEPSDPVRRAQNAWFEENREAIASINLFIEQRGLLASKLRYRPYREL